MPKKIIQKQYNKLVYDYNKAVNGNEINSILKEYIIKNSKYIKLKNYYENMLQAAINYSLAFNFSQTFINLYEKEFGEFNHIDCIEKIEKAYKRNLIKYEQTIIDEQQDNSITFDEFIFKLGAAYGQQIDKENTYLNEIPYYIKYINDKYKKTLSDGRN